MLALKKDIYITFFMILTGGLVTLFIFSYIIVKKFFLDHVDKVYISEFNLLWLLIGTAFVVFLIICFAYIRRLEKKISEDMQEITEYLQEINSKNYSAPLHIKHYLECLHISILLKNIVKRINKRKK